MSIADHSSDKISNINAGRPKTSQYMPLSIFWPKTPAGFQMQQLTRISAVTFSPPTHPQPTYSIPAPALSPPPQFFFGVV